MVVEAAGEASPSQEMYSQSGIRLYRKVRRASRNTLSVSITLQSREVAQQHHQ